MGLFKRFGKWVKGVAVPAASQILTGNISAGIGTVLADGRKSRTGGTMTQENKHQPALYMGTEKNGTIEKVDYTKSTNEKMNNGGSFNFASLLMPAAVVFALTALSKKR